MYKYNESIGYKKKLRDEFILLKKNKRGKISDELLMILTCRRMGWDYFTYMAQPYWFINSMNEIENLINTK